MSKIVYLDTNVFDHIVKRHGVSDSDYDALTTAIGNGKITIVASFLNIEEMMSTIRSSPDIGRQQLKFILAHADFRKFVRSQDEIIGDAIRYYARGNSTPNPFTVCDRRTRRALSSMARRATPSPDLRWIVDEARKAKQQFKRSLDKAKKNASTHSKEDQRPKLPVPEVYWKQQGLAG